MVRVVGSTSAASSPLSSEAFPPLRSRAAEWRALGDAAFDLLVVGGGVTGAGIARDAALRGLKVALLEREDFASGTSSRSSRLIHGGLRYLEHGHLGLVFESSIERKRLSLLAPHLVRPLAFTWPVYRGARVPRWKLFAGMMLYDALALFRNFKGFRQLSRKALLEREPHVNPQGLAGGALYYDAATDDARLTFVNALGAAEAGATVLNHVQVTGFGVSEGRTRTATVLDTRTGATVQVHARVFVNATGPWTNELRRMDGEGEGEGVRGSKGVHLSVPRERVGNREALTVLSPLDGRVMFILPAGAHAIIGTTETVTQAHPAEVRASEADVAYLLASANAFFPEAKLTRADVVSAWAGIRPLIAQGYGQGGASGASREHALHRSPTGVLAISGGKLTTYRVMAKDVVDAVQRELGNPVHRSPTEKLRLPGGELTSVEEERRAAEAAGLKPATAEHLVHAYGTRWRQIWALVQAQASLAEPLVPGLPYLKAEVLHGVQHEWVVTLADLLTRRLKVAFETRDLGLAAASTCARLLTDAGHWTAEEATQALQHYALDAHRLFSVDPA